jgi:hypothetical protein
MTAPAAAALADHAAAIRALGKQTVENVIEIGRHLVEAKAEVKKLGASFDAWLKAEFNWSHGQAYNFINVFERKSELSKFDKSDLPISAFYLLAAPSTPAEARDEIIERAQAGEAVGVDEVKRVIKGAKGRKQSARKPRKAKRAKVAAPPPPSGRSEPPPRDDVGPTSSGELARKDAEIAELRNAKRQFELQIEGLRSEVREVGDKRIEQLIAERRKWADEPLPPLNLDVLPFGDQLIILISLLQDGLAPIRKLLAGLQLPSNASVKTPAQLEGIEALAGAVFDWMSITQERVEEIKQALDDYAASVTASTTPPTTAPVDESPEEYWRRSLTALADEVITRPAYHWPDNWKKFEVPLPLLDHATRAMTTLCDLVKQLSAQVALPPPDDGLDLSGFLDRTKQREAIR